MSHNDILRKIIRELIEQELEEVSTSAAAGPYDTPNAFSGPSAQGKAARKRIALKASGYTLAGKDDEEGGHIDENRYYAFRNDTTASPAQKIGRAIQEINRNLTELDRSISMSSRLKLESNIESSGLWKRTPKHLLKIEARLHKILERVRELKS